MTRPGRAALLIPLICSLAAPAWAGALGSSDAPTAAQARGAGSRGISPPAAAIVDDAGRTLLLRGVNVGNKRAPYLPSMAEEDWARLKGWGLNSVRLLLFWTAVEPSEGVYDDAWLDGVAELLDAADAHGLKVVLDLHQDVFGVGFGFDGAPRWACSEALYERFEPVGSVWWLNYLTPEVAGCFTHLWGSARLQARLVEAWGHVAERLGDHPAVFGFDLFNEPFGGLAFGPGFERDALQGFYEAAAARIRQAAPEAWIFFEPSVLHNAGIPTALSPLGMDRVAFAPHFYHLPMEISSTYDGHQRAIEAMLGRFAEEADALGAPMWVGELGGNTASPDYGPFLTDTFDVLDLLQSGGALWEYGSDSCGGFSVLGCDGEPQGEVVGALARPYPRAVAGALGEVSWDADAASLHVRWTPDPSIPLPTEVVVPEEALPGAFDWVVSPPMPSRWDEGRRVLEVGPAPDAEPRDLWIVGAR